jgi:hypothetical protein
MTVTQRTVLIVLSIAVPITLWLAVLVVYPLFPPAMGLAGVFFDLLVLPLVLVSGFLCIRKALPERPWLLGFLYFPVMAGMVLYLGVVFAFWLGRDAL